MRHLTALVEGEQLTHTIGRVTIAVTCVREGAAYRAGVHYGGTAGLLGKEIEELSASYPTEAEARQAARRLCKAFADQPADLPFAVLVERALAHLAAQLDDEIGKAFGGGDGTGRVQAPLAGLTRAREALYTPAERIAEQMLVEQLRADLELYDTDERYRQACAEAVADDEGSELVRTSGGETRTAVTDVRADEGPATSWAQIRDRHRAAVERDRRAA